MDCHISLPAEPQNPPLQNTPTMTKLKKDSFFFSWTLQEADSSRTAGRIIYTLFTRTLDRFRSCNLSYFILFRHDRAEVKKKNTGHVIYVCLLPEVSCIIFEYIVAETPAGGLIMAVTFKICIDYILFTNLELFKISIN